MKPSHARKKTVIARIKSIEEAIAKGREYLQTGAYADWRGFRPLFNAKMKDGKALPPHPDWVKNWFIPGHERALQTAEKMLEQIEIELAKKRNSN